MKIVCSGALGILLLAGCSESSPKASCSEFEASATRLQDELGVARQVFDRDNKTFKILPSQLDADRAAITRARRVYAEFYVRDTTGCARPEDKARAQADLDSLNEGTP